MRYAFIILSFFLSTNLLSQDSTACKCSFTTLPKYPKKAEENKISGTVIIEMDIAEDGSFSNPVVRKGVGYGCDEEALRIASLFIHHMNQCNERCSKKKGKRGKILQPIKFETPEE